MSSENTAPQTDLVKVSDVARALNCTTQTVRNLIRRGDIKAHRVGIDFRISKTSVDVYLERTAVQASAA